MLAKKIKEEDEVRVCVNAAGYVTVRLALLPGEYEYATRLSQISYFREE